ncbi:hypothetical protein DY000_02050836 [Brassica cretica]|uniref:DUF4005 domain-containing protein n=1 Tax=Brassica cretica TaxID=69181 RepID=A0ABQ7EU36_BRACR|nr:hypothetical protein DY000_02050836 [Brassica cretica]
MEAFEELIATSKEQSLILKGKRTKRQRPKSHVPFSISPPIVSCPARDVIEEYTYLDSKENALGNNVENHKKDGVITSSSSSASWSSQQPNNIESRRRRGKSRYSQLFDRPFPRPLSSTSQDT